MFISFKPPTYKQLLKKAVLLSKLNKSFFFRIPADATIQHPGLGMPGFSILGAVFARFPGADEGAARTPRSHELRVVRVKDEDEWLPKVISYKDERRRRR